MNILCFQTTTLMDKYFRHWIPGVWSLSQGKIYYTSVSYNLNKKEKHSWYVSLWKCDMSLKVSSTLSKNWNRYCSHTCNAIRCHNMLTSFPQNTHLDTIQDFLCELGMTPCILRDVCLLFNFWMIKFTIMFFLTAKLTEQNWYILLSFWGNERRKSQIVRTMF